MSNTTLTGQPAESVHRRISALWPVLAAAALGIAILYVVGFGGAETIHNAAHDTRHSLNFPCH